MQPQPPSSLGQYFKQQSPPKPQQQKSPLPSPVLTNYGSKSATNSVSPVRNTTNHAQFQQVSIVSIKTTKQLRGTENFSKVQ